MRTALPFDHFSDWPGRCYREAGMSQDSATMSGGLERAVRASAGQSLDIVEPGEVAIERPHRQVPGLARNLDDEAI